MGGYDMAKTKKREMTRAKVKARHRRVSHDELPFLNNTASHIFLGAAAGCAVGAVAALFLAPKPKRHKFTQGIDELYDQVTGAADEYGHDALEKGKNAYKAARDSAENIYTAASHAFAKAGKVPSRNLILGVIGAGLLGAAAVYALSQKSEDNEGFLDKWKTSKWSDMAKLVVDSVSNKLHGDEDAEINEEDHSPFQNIIDWAAVGLNLWQEIKKRR